LVRHLAVTPTHAVNAIAQHIMRLQAKNKPNALLIRYLASSRKFKEPAWQGVQRWHHRMSWVL
jgi:hypothetical protein